MRSPSSSGCAAQTAVHHSDPGNQDTFIPPAMPGRVRAVDGFRRIPKAQLEVYDEFLDLIYQMVR